MLQIKERHEPRKRLSYALETRHGFLTIDESIAQNISLTYKGRSADKLTYVLCDVKNTGNSVIKNEFLRFEFSEESCVLDAYTEPTPPNGYGVLEVSEPQLKPHERRYQIKHLEKQQQIGFRFVLSDAPELHPKIIPFNEEGNVDLTAASISRASDDRQRVEQFVYLFVLILIIPPIFNFLPGFLSDVAVSLTYLILGVAMLPLLKPFSRAIAVAIAALERPQHAEISIAELNQAEGAGLSIATGQGVATFKSYPK